MLKHFIHKIERWNHTVQAKQTAPQDWTQLSSFQLNQGHSHFRILRTNVKQHNSFHLNDLFFGPYRQTKNYNLRDHRVQHNITTEEYLSINSFYLRMITLGFLVQTIKLKKV